MTNLPKQLANPIASLISVPFQSNYDCCFGPLKGGEYTLNVQPVIPISINAQWNLILRTIVPVTGAQPTSPTSPQILLPDIGFRPDNRCISTNRQHVGPWGHHTEFFPFAEKSNEQRHHSGRWPRVSLPDRNERYSRRASLGSGPTAVALKQQGPWTYGVLANHLWSFAETSSLGPDVNSTFIQPFIGYTTSSAFTTTINTEIDLQLAQSQVDNPYQFALQPSRHHRWPTNQFAGWTEV